MLQKKFGTAVRQHYPNALDTRDTSIKYLGLLQNGHNIDVSKILLATSLCSDDMNIPSTSFFRVMLGPFFLGGLGGLPFAGTTGMSAFAHHIPDNGSAFIFYGPHIGITSEGDLGKMYRPRQEESGFCCGALMLALSRFKNADFKPELKEDDYQQTMLEKVLFDDREEILSAENPEQAITEKAFLKIEEMIYKYLRATKSQFKVNKITLLGGIIINTDYGVDDYFEVRNFEIINKKHL
ncbi:MAG TPA: hypothetical protein VJ894_05070 [Cryomorphaceae bacterium]|nr:hypothetical protein [Cryomorphaceae bacterium]